MIKPTSFYSCKREKIKLNWFCYELAMGIYDEIAETHKKQLKKHKIDQGILANFSIYMSKKMKGIILQQLSGEIEHVYFSHEMIESYFPNFDNKLINKILDTIEKAWDELLGGYVICPTRCISEKDAHCTLFDEENFD